MREQLLKDISQILTSNERHFLLSIIRGDPDYSLLPFDHLGQLPVLQLKLINVRIMEKSKQVSVVNKLKAVLDV